MGWTLFEQDKTMNNEVQVVVFGWTIQNNTDKRFVAVARGKGSCPFARYEGAWFNGNIAPLILNLDNSWP